MAPFIDDWRKEVRRWAASDLRRRTSQDDTIKGQSRAGTKSNRDDSSDSGSGGAGGAGKGGGSGSGGGGGAGNGNSNGNDGTSAGGGKVSAGSGSGGGGGGGGRGNGGGGGTGGSGRGGSGNGAGAGGGGRFGNNDDDDSNDKKSSNSGNNNGDGGRSKNTDSSNDDSNKGTSPPVAFSPQESTASPPPAAITTSVVPAPATDVASSTSASSPTDSPSPTDTPTSVPGPSTVILVSTVTPAPSAPGPVMTTFIPLMTTTALPDTDPSAPRKGLDDPASPADDSATSTSLGLKVTALADTNPTSTGLAASGGLGRNGTNNNTGGKNGDRYRGNGNGFGNGTRNGNNGNRNKDDITQESGLDPISERVLISVGSIGGFISICFLIWIVWRMIKKSKAKKNRGISPASSMRWPRLVLPDRVLARVPFLKNRQRQWQNLDDSSVTGVRPPSYKSGMAQVEPVKEFYAQEKTYQLPSRRQSMDQSNNASPMVQNLPNLAFANNPLTLNTNVSPVSYQPTSGQSPPNFAYTNSPLTLNTNVPTPFSHQPAQSFSSTNAAQFGGMRASTDETATFRSRMPDAYYNQSELARGPSDAYDPAMRQVNRASQLSSISSGFGDGDIIMPNNMIQPPQPATTNMRQSANLVGRFSWVSQSLKSQRDTISTQSSEDLPPRFRNVNSWVDQQTGRVKRAQQRNEDGQEVPPVPVLSSQQVGVPGIHNPPAEQSFNMMMGDDEMPRRVEDTFVSTLSPQR